MKSITNRAKDVFWVGDKMEVPCGRCLPCLSKKKHEWQHRIEKELLKSNTAYFVGITYDPENIPIKKIVQADSIWGYKPIESLKKKDLQLFIKRIRKAQEDLGRKLSKIKHKESAKERITAWNNRKSIRYYGIGEYGGKTSRPHYHLLLFNVLPEIIERLADIWNMGIIDVGDVEPDSISYCLKYMVKPDWWEAVEEHQEARIIVYKAVSGRQFMEGEEVTKYKAEYLIEPPFSVMSRGGQTKDGKKTFGIGHDWIEENKRDFEREDKDVIFRNGYPQRLSRYYREKIEEPSLESRKRTYQAVAEAHQKKIRDLKKKGYEDPEAEIEFRQAEQERRIKKQVLKSEKL